MATLRARKESAHWPDYSMVRWDLFDYSLFKHIIVKNRSNKLKTTYNNVIIMADTETSKKPAHGERKDNHIVAWSCAFRAYGRNLVTLWGQNPYDFTQMLQNVRDNLEGELMYVFFHNLGYDWVFLRKFMFECFGFPSSQLNTKPLNPLTIQWDNGIIFKNSLALSQRSLDKWSRDLHIETLKAVGFWNYDKLRNQSDILSEKELIYIEHDVLAGVECIDVTIAQLHKTLSSLPLTATGIVRGEARNEGRKHKAHKNFFQKIQPKELFIQHMLQLCFHGGYTHANRYAVDFVFPGAICYDFSSSYPYVLLSEKYPSEQFWKVERKVSPEYILKNSEDYAFIFRITLTNFDLKQYDFPMPTLALAKCTSSINCVIDNGRIIKGDFIETYMNEIDFKLLTRHYKFKAEDIEITDCYASFKDYLPKWFTDYVWERYRLKTELKGVDPVLYGIEKAKLNSCYGMSAQKPVKVMIDELYEDTEIDGEIRKSGEYIENEDFNEEKEYKKFLDNHNSFLPYTCGVWCTAYAQYNLFELGKAVPNDRKHTWIYSDTDSIYADAFDESVVEAYNEKCIKKLNERGYKGVMYKGKLYYPGVAEFDGRYTQFKTLHSKCYVKRPWVADGNGFTMADELKITIAGVPKKGNKTLHNNIDEFKIGTVFPGTDSGKLQHSHCFVDEIYTDENGNITGDSIDLTPCDYIVKDSLIPDLDDLLYEEVEVIDYESE